MNVEIIQKQELAQVITSNKSIISSVCVDGVLDFGKILSKPKVWELEKKMGEQNMFNILKGSVLILNYKLNIKHKMDDLQIDLFVADLMQECNDNDYRLEELVYFFEQVAKSKYGKIYERLDQALLFEFLAVYEKESAKKVNEFYVQKNKPLPAPEEPVQPMSEKTRAMLEESKAMLIAKSKEAPQGLSNTARDFMSGLKSYTNQIKCQKVAQAIEKWDGKIIEQ